MSINNVKVCIGLPVYNGMPYIKNAVELLSAQTHSNIVIIISDNNSNDGTSEYLLEESKVNKKIIYHRQSKPLPVMENFRYVINRCESDYFFFAAHDDKWDPMFIEKLLPFLMNKDALCAFSLDKVENYISGKITDSFSPEINLKASAFENLRMFITAPKPHVIYGIFRHQFIKNYMNHHDMAFDWSDVIFGYHVMVSGKVMCLQEPLYTAGITDIERIPKTFGKKRLFFNWTYRYSKYFFEGIKLIYCSCAFSAFQKVVLTLSHTRVVIFSFIHQEVNNTILKFILKIIYRSWAKVNYFFKKIKT